jgi:hypothetical protein
MSLKSVQSDLRHLTPARCQVNYITVYIISLFSSESGLYSANELLTGVLKTNPRTFVESRETVC